MHAGEAGTQELLPVGEVHVHRRAGHARLGRDLVHRHVDGAAFAEQPPGNGDDLVPPEVADDLFDAFGGIPRHGQDARRAAAGKRTGMCFTPLMNCDCRRCTSPAGSISGIRSRRCSNMTRISMRAKLAPRQK